VLCAAVQTRRLLRWIDKEFLRYNRESTVHPSLLGPFDALAPPQVVRARDMSLVSSQILDFLFPKLCVPTGAGCPKNDGVLREQLVTAVTAAEAETRRAAQG
jgi:hypothetical protein